MSNSKLIDYRKISPNKTIMTNKKNDTITIHCMAGQLSVETCGDLFASPKRNASSNYGIGPDGRVGMYVEEKDRSWATSSRSNDSRAITIEVASDSKPPYKVTQEAYDKLILLVVDICKRNGIKKLLWKGDKSLIGQVSKQNMTVHRWFANKACPGDYLYNKHPDIVKAVNKQLKGNDDPEPKPEPKPSNKEYKIEAKVRALNIRTGPAKTYKKVGIMYQGHMATIVETQGNWGKLKSGRGWICVDNKHVRIVSGEQPDNTTPKAPEYAVGKTYTLQEEMRVRKGPGTRYAAKIHAELSADGKKHDKDGDGALDKGTKITCKEISKSGKNIWIRCASGWIAAFYNNKIYVK